MSDRKTFRSNFSSKIFYFLTSTENQGTKLLESRRQILCNFRNSPVSPCIFFTVFWEIKNMRTSKTKRKGKLREGLACFFMYLKLHGWITFDWAHCMGSYHCHNKEKWGGYSHSAISHSSHQEQTIYLLPHARDHKQPPPLYKTIMD